MRERMSGGVAPWIAALATLTLGCATGGVRVDYDREVSFKGLTTYAWVDSGRVATDSTAGPFLERRVRRSIDRGLADRGFRLDASGRPDFLVTALVIGPTRAERSWSYWPARPCGPAVTFSLGLGYPFGYGLHHRRWPWSYPYYRFPWGYACSFRVGYGYVWLPVYEDPGDRIGGTLVIDILDARTRDLVWRGSAEDALPRDATEDVSQEELDQIAARILREFPPGSGR